MKRRIVKICVFLLAGAILNVAVAWVCVHYRPADSSALQSTLDSGEVRWVEELGMAFDPKDVILVNRNRSIGADIRHFIFAPAIADSADASLGSRFDGGFPFLSLRGRIVPAISETLTFFSEATYGRATYETCTIYQVGDESLPLKPIWPGFAINTIFYAAILWLLIAARGFVRSRIRIKRGQCPACAYPVGTNPVCTECGRPVSK